MEGKRGAVELSITTIVVVVIGITLLVLGLTFVYNIFADIGEQQKQLGEFTDEQIRDIFAGSDQSLNLPTTDFTVELGKIFNLDIVIKNNVQDNLNERCKFVLVVQDPNTADQVDPADWFSFSQAQDNLRVAPGPGLKVRAQIHPIRSNAALGTYLMNLRLTGEGRCGVETATSWPVDEVPLSITVV